jgi:tetratricopeptide (TPR) repeat protein
MEIILMTVKKWLMVCCLSLVALGAQAATQDEQLELAATYNTQVEEYYEQGLFKQALPLAEEALRIRTEILGEKHPDTLTSLNNLAIIYQYLGRLSEALPLFEKCYRLRKEVLGEKHLLTLTSMNNLAVIYQYLGRIEEALPLLEKVYRLKKEVLGEKHSSTLTSMNNLAFVYNNLGRIKEALPLLETGYRISYDVLGEKHPDTLTRLNNLAFIYNKLGRIKEALPLFEKGYRLSSEVLGEKHPDTLNSRNNLALIYQYLGRLSEALPLFEKGYHLYKELLGEKHPSTLTIMNNLAMIYKDLGSIKEALPWFEKGYRLSYDALGEKHPLTLRSMNNLAGIYKDLGRLSEALPLFEKGYRLYKELLGEQHPETLRIRNNLAIIYQDLGRLSEALPLFEKGYRLYKELLGEQHPETLKILNNLAGIYKNLGRLSEALPLFEKGYRLYKELLGEKHPDTLTSLNNLGRIYQDLGRLEEALPLLEKGYRISSEVLGEKHPETLNSRNNLAGIYKNLDRLEEALPLFEKAYRFSSEVLGEKHPSTLKSLTNLAGSYQNSGSLEEALPLYEKFVEGVETLRSGNFSAENRQSLFKQFVSGYFILSNLYIYQSRPFDAFRLAEMSKARTLLESLAPKLAAQQSGLTSTEQQQLQNFEARLALINNRIAKSLENNHIEKMLALEAEKNQLVKKSDQFHQKLIAKYSKYAQLSQVQIISAKKGAKHLPTNAVLISYLTLKNGVLAFTLQADGTLTAHDLGEIPDLKTDLETYRHLLARAKAKGRGTPILGFGKQPPQNLQSLSLKLGKALLEPLKKIIKDKPHWIISPDGPLALIPFETLRLEGEKQPVIAQHQISYVQSLSVLAQLQKRNQVYQRLEKRGTLLAMGAPLYEKGAATTKSHPSAVDFQMARQMVNRGGDYDRAFRQLGQQKWSELPGALDELEQLKQLFKDTNPRIYEQEKATEAQLQELNKQGTLSKYRYLVFSAHGYLSPQVPALSSIVLGQVNNPPKIDGYVTAGEWPGYDLKSDLMVLSACQTGLGEVMSGEGVMGLPYAFYVAGNKNTILTLWSISDEVTVEFITSFFTKLKAGKGQIEALTETKREFLKKGGRYSNPVYWAAFVLYGV